MGSTALSVHGSLPNKTVLFSSLHEFQTICIVSDSVLGQPFYKDSINFGLVDVEWFGLGKILQQIINFFVVNLQK